MKVKQELPDGNAVGVLADSTDSSFLSLPIPRSTAPPTPEMNYALGSPAMKIADLPTESSDGGATVERSYIHVNRLELNNPQAKKYLDDLLHKIAAFFIASDADASMFHHLSWMPGCDINGARTETEAIHETQLERFGVSRERLSKLCYERMVGGNVVMGNRLTSPASLTTTKRIFEEVIIEQMLVNMLRSRIHINESHLQNMVEENSILQELHDQATQDHHKLNRVLRFHDPQKEAYTEVCANAFCNALKQTETRDEDGMKNSLEIKRLTMKCGQLQKELSEMTMTANVEKGHRVMRESSSSFQEYDLKHASDNQDDQFDFKHMLGKFKEHPNPSATPSIARLKKENEAMVLFFEQVRLELKLLRGSSDETSNLSSDDIHTLHPNSSSSSSSNDLLQVLRSLRTEKTKWELNQAKYQHEIRVLRTELDKWKKTTQETIEECKRRDELDRCEQQQRDMQELKEKGILWRSSTTTCSVDSSGCSLNNSDAIAFSLKVEENTRNSRYSRYSSTRDQAVQADLPRPHSNDTCPPRELAAPLSMRGTEEEEEEVENQKQKQQQQQQEQQQEQQQQPSLKEAVQQCPDFESKWKLLKCRYDKDVHAVRMEMKELEQRCEKLQDELKVAHSKHSYADRVETARLGLAMVEQRRIALGPKDVDEADVGVDEADYKTRRETMKRYQYDIFQLRQQLISHKRFLGTWRDKMLELEKATKTDLDLKNAEARAPLTSGAKEMVDEDEMENRIRNELDVMMQHTGKWIEQAKSKVVTLNEKLASAKANHQQLCVDIETKDMETKQLRSQIIEGERKWMEEKSILRTDLLEKKYHCDSLAAQLQSAERETKDLRLAVDKWKESSSAFEEECELLTRELNHARDIANTNRDELVRLEKLRNDEQGKIQEQNQEFLLTLESERRATLGEMQFLRKENEEALKLIHDQKEYIFRQMEDEKQQLILECGRLKVSLKQFKMNVKGLTQKNARQQSCLSMMQEDLDGGAQNAIKLQTECNRIQHVVQELVIQQRIAEDKIKQLEQEVKEKDAEMIRLQRKAREFKHVVKQVNFVNTKMENALRDRDEAELEMNSLSEVLHQELEALLKRFVRPMGGNKEEDDGNKEEDGGGNKEEDGDETGDDSSSSSSRCSAVNAVNGSHSALVWPLEQFLGPTSCVPYSTMSTSTNSSGNTNSVKTALGDPRGVKKGEAAAVAVLAQEEMMEEEMKMMMEMEMEGEDLLSQAEERKIRLGIVRGENQRLREEMRRLSDQLLDQKRYYEGLISQVHDRVVRTERTNAQLQSTVDHLTLTCSEREEKQSQVRNLCLFWCMKTWMMGFHARRERKIWVGAMVDVVEQIDCETTATFTSISTESLYSLCTMPFISKDFLHGVLQNCIASRAKCLTYLTNEKKAVLDLERVLMVSNDRESYWVREFEGITEVIRQLREQMSLKLEELLLWKDKCYDHEHDILNISASMEMVQRELSEEKMWQEDYKSLKYTFEVQDSLLRKSEQQLEEDMQRLEMLHNENKELKRCQAELRQVVETLCGERLEESLLFSVEATHAHTIRLLRRVSHHLSNRSDDDSLATLPSSSTEARAKNANNASKPSSTEESQNPSVSSLDITHFQTVFENLADYCIVLSSSLRKCHGSSRSISSTTAGDARHLLNQSNSNELNQTLNVNGRDDPMDLLKKKATSLSSSHQEDDMNLVVSKSLEMLELARKNQQEMLVALTQLSQSEQVTSKVYNHLMFQQQCRRARSFYLWKYHSQYEQKYEETLESHLQQLIAVRNKHKLDKYQIKEVFLEILKRLQRKLFMYRFFAAWKVFRFYSHHVSVSAVNHSRIVRSLYDDDGHDFSI